ncbi:MULTISPECIES: BRO family protein [Prauserella salsuginis group]|uniref:Prophage antirepressor-like protein n=2 Tax=Prauserella salsuginis group TaxID=2893672 RepID=A0A839XRF3_9PSEU|nr:MULTISPECIES: phage antirepressor KilAC domain-containing protein [Prauserella salsuginis group]MBB3666372.1 prophage antirepressor-like protein [Prauserella sediminis]MCR3719161.1 Phage antirepressor protein KilAC domain-containing protein [Prauserella flava]MCR3735826.1 Phage antirepressor protein KilAC domain-containing protein [Prauserella salsuginis]
MTDLTPFTYGTESIRVVTVNGEPWFVAADVCRAISVDITQTRRLEDDEKGLHSVQTPGGHQSVTIVNEPGLYSLILRSRKPEARRFQRWITHEVIPSIRRTGGYGQPQIPGSYAEALEAAARQAREREAAEQRARELEPSANAWEMLVDATGDYSMREAAQILDRDPAINMGQNRLARYLRENAWVDRKGTPYQRKVDRGQLVARILPYQHPHTGESKLDTQVRVTAKGMRELHRMLGGERPLRLDPPPEAQPALLPA